MHTICFLQLWIRSDNYHSAMFIAWFVLLWRFRELCFLMFSWAFSLLLCLWSHLFIVCSVFYWIINGEENILFFLKFNGLHYLFFELIVNHISLVNTIQHSDIHVIKLAAQNIGAYGHECGQNAKLFQFLWHSWLSKALLHLFCLNLLQRTCPYVSCAYTKSIHSNHFKIPLLKKLIWNFLFVFDGLLNPSCKFAIVIRW